MKLLIGAIVRRRQCKLHAHGHDLLSKPSGSVRRCCFGAASVRYAGRGCPWDKLFEYPLTNGIPKMCHLVGMGFLERRTLSDPRHIGLRRWPISEGANLFNT